MTEYRRGRSAFFTRFASVSRNVGTPRFNRYLEHRCPASAFTPAPSTSHIGHLSIPEKPNGCLTRSSSPLASTCIRTLTGQCSTKLLSTKWLISTPYGRLNRTRIRCDVTLKCDCATATTRPENEPALLHAGNAPDTHAVYIPATSALSTSAALPSRAWHHSMSAVATASTIRPSTTTIGRT